MTLSSETVVKSYAGDGATTTFPTVLTFWDNTDIEVILRDSDGTETTWTEGTQYTLTGGDGSTGTVEVETSPTDYTPAASETLVIRSARSNLQSVDLPTGGSLPSDEVEQGLDQVTRLVQQLVEEIGRCLKLSKTVLDSPTLEMTELAADRADKYLGFSGDGSTLSLLSALAGSSIFNDDNMGSGSGSNTQATSQDSVYQFVTNLLLTGIVTMANKTLTAPTLNSPVLNLADIRSLIGGSDAAGDMVYRNATKYVRLAKGTAKQRLAMNSAADAPEWVTPIFTESFTSAAQTISHTSLLTLAHSLSSTPYLVMAVIKCTSTDAGYAVGDEVILPASFSSVPNDTSEDRGFTTYVDSTNVYVRFSSTSNITIFNKGDGTSGSTDPTKWEMYIRAWA